MKYRQLGNSGIQVSEIGFGAWAIGGPFDVFGIPAGMGAVDDRQSMTALERAHDLGINFFDTADVYGNGHSEEMIGKCAALKNCVIATKVGNVRNVNPPIKLFTRDHLRKSIEQSLIRLKRDFVDLYQLHNPPPEVLQGDEVFETLRELKAEGKIRLTGVSIYTIEEGIHLVERKRVDCLQVLFNILNQAPAKRLFRLAQTNGVGLLARVPLASGLLTGKFTAESKFAPDDNRRLYLTPKRMPEVVARVERLKEIVKDTGATLPQIALAFILKHAAISAPIPGAKTPEQVEQNASAFDVSLSGDLFEMIRQEFSGYNFYLRNGIKL